MFIQKKSSRSLRFVLMTIATMVLSVGAIWAQNVKVSGTVKDNAGEPLIGVYVLVQGTATGTSTDIDGKYTLSAPANANLVFSLLGMKDAVVPVNNRSTIDVVMEEDAVLLDEVVMVAYGSQKKENLSGAVSSINVGKSLESRPITDVGRALQGSTPGLIVTTTSGALGGTPTIKIRGTTSTLGGGSGNPLILVDNVEVPDLSYVNPDDIESISTLKDASTTSIYGARAAFGAILITTKKGSKDGKVKVSYSNNFAWQTETSMPDFTRADLGQQYSLDQVNGLNAVPVTFIQPYAGYKITTESIAKTREWIEKYGNGAGLGREMVEGRDFDYQDVTGSAVYYRPWDVLDLFYKDWAPQQTHNISVSGGNEKMQYNLSAGLMNQKGMLKEFDDFYKRKSVSANVSTKVHDRVTLRGSFMFTSTNQESPMSFYDTGTDAQQETIYTQTYYIYRWHNVNPYGTYNGKEFRNGISEFKQAKPLISDKSYNRITLGATIDIVKGLKANFDYTYSQTNLFEHRQGGQASAIDIFSNIPAGSTFDDMFRMYTTAGFADHAAYDSSRNRRNAYNGNLSYENTFGKHNIKILAGTNIEDADYVYHRTKRRYLASNTMAEPNLANGATVIASNHSWWSVAGVFARVNYDFNGKYLIEGNIRYDESSKFAEGSRGGLFPSFSAAWRVTEEPWMQDIKHIVNSLKLRGSYGVIGNQDVPLGSYIPSLTLTTPTSGNRWLVNGAYASYVSSAAALVDPALSWEKVGTLDLGIDAKFWNDKIGVTFDWYQRKTMDMLSAGNVIPSSVGASAPKQNFGELTTNGVELELSFNHVFGNGLRLSVNANYSDYITEISEWAAADDPLYSNNYVGKRMGDIWGYKVDRLWQQDDFVYENGSLATTNVNGKVTNVLKDYEAGYQALYESGNFRFSPGDIKIKDLNGDGVINYGKSTLSDHGDLAVIGNTEPRHLYSFRIGANWKGIDLDIFFQGVGKRELWVSGNMVLPGWQALEANFAHTLDYWTPDNTDAFYPRPIQYGNAQKWNYITNDRYLLNMAYLRCKNLTVGYTFPNNLMNKIHVNRLRVYASAENLFEFDKLGDNPIDPELQHTSGTSGDARAFGRAYPYRRTISFGVQLDF